MKLLLINGNVREYEKLVDAALPDVEVIVYGRNNVYSYEDIKDGLNPANDSYESVGIIFEMPRFKPEDYDFLPEEGLTNDRFSDFLASLNTSFYDFITCSLYNETEWKDYFDSLESSLQSRLKNSDVKVRFSHDPTGNLEAGGNWIMESEANPVNVENIYFSETIEAYTELLGMNTNINWVSSNLLNEVDIQYQSGGSGIHVWGESNSGGGIPPDNLDFGDLVLPIGVTVKKVYSNNNASAALLSDTSVYIWGDSTYGGSNDPNDAGKYGLLKVGENVVTGIKTIRYTAVSFAAITFSGQVYTWGRNGTVPNGGVTTLISGLVTQKIYSTISSFAAIVAEGDDQGKVWVWGANSTGANITDPTIPALYANVNPENLINVVKIVSNYGAFAAIRSDGRVFVWGSSGSGGKNSSALGAGPGLISNLIAKSIYPNLTTVDQGTFAAICGPGMTGPDEGDVYIWGNIARAGSITNNIITSYYVIPSSYGAAQPKNIEKMVSTNGAYAAISYPDGTGERSVYTWGQQNNGGNLNAFNGARLVYNVTSGIKNDPDDKIVDIYANQGAFGVLLSNADPSKDGTMKVWGNAFVGGSHNYSIAATEATAVYVDNPSELITGITQVTSSLFGFSIGTANGDVYNWGDATGDNFGSPAAVAAVVAGTLRSNTAAFACIQGGSTPETLQVFGYIPEGGNQAQVDGVTNVTEVYSNSRAFAALLGASDPVDINAPATLVASLNSVTTTTVTLSYIYIGVTPDSFVVVNVDTGTELQAADSSPITVENLSPGTTYNLRIDAILDGEVIASSNVVVATTTSEPPQPSGDDTRDTLANISLIIGLVIIGIIVVVGILSFFGIGEQSSLSLGSFAPIAIPIAVILITGAIVLYNI